MKKRLLSILLALVMVVALLPVTGLAVTEADPFNLIVIQPKTGNSPVEAYSAPDEYSYSVSWSSLHVSSAITKWTYLDEYNVEQTIVYPETFKPETAYTVHITLQLSSGYEFADPPQITINGTAPEYEVWSTYDTTYVVLRRVFPATEPLSPITKVAVTGTEPLCGAYADDTVTCEYIEPYTIENAYFHDIYYNTLTSSDKFVAGETYTLVVDLKARDYAKFTTDLTAEDCVLNPDWLGEGLHPDIVTVYTDVFARMEFYWTIPEPISSLTLYANDQSYGENPSIYAWADSDAPYEVRATRYYDELYGSYLEFWDVLEEGHSYRMEVDVYPKKGQTLAGTVTATLNGAVGTYYQNNLGSFTIYFPAPLKMAEEIYTAKVTYDAVVDVGVHAADWAEVPAGEHYDIAYAVWYDEFGNDIYGFDFEDGKNYTFCVTLEPDMGYVFSDSAVFYFNGEAVAAVADGRLRTLAIPYHVSSWSPTVITEGTFDLTAGTPMGEYSALKDTLKALAAAGLVNAWEYAATLTCDLNNDGTVDIAIGPAEPDPSKDAITLTESTRSAEGTVSLSVNPAALTYLSDNAVPAYYESLVFFLPALTWTVSFDAAGGSGLMADVFVPRGSAYTLPSCAFAAPEGKVFDRWSVGAPGETITVSADLTLVAWWKDKPAEYWTVSFAADGGTGSMADASVEKGESFVLPPCAFTAPEGKEFDTWTLGDPGESFTPVSDTTVTAIWKDKPVEYWTISFDANGGTGTMTEVQVEKGAKYTLPECAFTPPEGKEFDAWNFGDPGDRITPAGDTVLTALWKDKGAEYWTISFDGNGGAGSMPEDQVEKGKSYVLPECTFTAPAGKVFVAWDLGGPGDRITPAEDTVLKAIWKDKGRTNPFVDVFGSDYFFDAVMWAYYAEPQVTNGIDATHFGPNNTVTRGQAVTFLWRAMGCPEPTSKDNPFEDVTEGKYYYKAVLWAVEKGITNGTDATHFTPNQTCSTAHIITFLYRTIEGPSKGDWYAVAEAWAKGRGLLADLSITVAPGVDCPRRDVVLFLYRALVP